MPPSSGRSNWADHAIAVLNELERHDDRLDRHDERLKDHDIALATLRVKATIIGAIAGMFASAILSGIIALLVHVLKKGGP